MPETPIKLKVFKPRKPDIFDRVKLSDAEIELLKLKKAIPGMISEAVEKAVSEIKLPEKKEIVKEIRIEAPKEKPKEYDGEIKELTKTIKELQERLEKLRSQVEDVPMPGGSGVIGLPDPNGKVNQILSVDKNGAKWSQEHPVGDLWRIRESGTALVFERYESGSWTEKGAFLA